MSDAARAAYVYGLPTVDLYRILHDFLLDTASPVYKGPFNTVSHNRRLADPSDATIVNLNVDTPYSYAWLDLRAEPVILRMPRTDADRYMSAELFDLYTYIVGYVSPRTNGHEGGTFLIAGPGWTGAAPAGMTVFDCPTHLCLVMVRTQLFDPADMANVSALQDHIAVIPLSTWINDVPPHRHQHSSPYRPWTYASHRRQRSSTSWTGCWTSCLCSRRMSGFGPRSRRCPGQRTTTANATRFRPG